MIVKGKIPLTIILGDVNYPGRLSLVPLYILPMLIDVEYI